MGGDGLVAGFHHVGCTGCTDYEAAECPLAALAPDGDQPAQAGRPTHNDKPETLGPRTRARIKTRVPAAIVAFGFVSLLTDLSTEAVNAVIPLYVTAVLGMGPLAYGFLDGIYQGVSAAVRILGGWWSDVSRRPKWVSFLGYGISALSKVGLLFVSGFPALMAIVTVDRLGKGVRTGPRDALIATASRPAQLGRDFGVHRALDTVGALLGPLTAFGVLAAIPWGAGGYHTVFVISAAVAALGLVVLVATVPDLRSAPRKLKKFGNWKDLRTRPMLRLYVVAGLLGVATIGDGFIYLTLSQRESLAAQYFPLLFVGTNAAFLALSIPLGKLADWIGRGTVFVGGHVALLAMYLLMLQPGGSVVWIAGVLLLSGVFYAATDVVIAALTSQIVAEQSRASGISAAQTVTALARFVSSVGFGFLWQIYGSGVAVMTSTALLVVAIGVGTTLLRPWLRVGVV